MNEVTRHLCDIKTMSPGGCLPLPRGYILYKIMEKSIKSDFKEIFLKLATNDRSDKIFLLTSTFCSPTFCQPLYKVMKKDFLKVVANDRSDKSLEFVVSHALPCIIHVAIKLQNACNGKTCLPMTW